VAIVATKLALKLNIEQFGIFSLGNVAVDLDWCGEIVDRPCAAT
jgi:hypothetical protein